MTLRTAEGSLNAIPEKIVFEKVYPVSNSNLLKIIFPSVCWRM
jgi:hypothetical protein